MAFALGQLLTRSAGRYPDRAAVSCRDVGLTYRELETLSNQLARALAARGVRKGDRVGICLKKSLDAVVAVFGILKAGAAYVPLDPSAPARRLGFIVGNCGMKALITTPNKLVQLQGALPDTFPLQCVVLANEAPARNGRSASEPGTVSWQELGASPAAPPAPTDLIEDDLAYILYTSGSTGEPKGVMISHRASLTFVNWAAGCFQVRATDRVSNHAPLHFDLSIFDIFTTVKAGATIVLVPEELSVFPINLADFIEQQRISIWYSVPSVLTRLVLYGRLEARQFPNLRQILFAGEVFPIKYLRQLRAAVPHAAFYNLYGPTETNVCTYFRVDDLPADQTEPVPIGRACENTEVFALDDQRKIAAPGEIGELYVRGPSLMRGYWGMPEKSGQMLVPHPLHPPMWEEKVYRTGDLVVRDHDGNYRFVGRRDNMIKSRGYRIELGEIETALYSHPEIEEAAALALPDDEIGNLIYAVAVRRHGSVLTNAEVQAFCAERIPRYMIPGTIEFRSSLPRTSTGKVDRSSLVREQLDRKIRSAVQGDAT
jgi:amino acid adenylation domain-containing protein